MINFQVRVSLFIKEYIYMPTETIMRANLTRIKSMGWENKSTKMDRSIKVTGPLT